MALPVNIDDLINHWKVEWVRIEYKEGCGQGVKTEMNQR